MGGGGGFVTSLVGRHMETLVEVDPDTKRLASPVLEEWSCEKLIAESD